MPSLPHVLAFSGSAEDAIRCEKVPAAIFRIIARRVGASPAPFAGPAPAIEMLAMAGGDCAPDRIVFAGIVQLLAKLPNYIANRHRGGQSS